MVAWEEAQQTTEPLDQAKRVNMEWKQILVSTLPSFTKKGDEGRALFKIGDLRLSRKRVALLSKAPFRGRHIDGYHPLPTSNVGPTLIGRETSQALLEPSKLKAPLVDISSAS